jgi:hypothetical protein
VTEGELALPFRTPGARRHGMGHSELSRRIEPDEWHSMAGEPVSVTYAGSSTALMMWMMPFRTETSGVAIPAVTSASRVSVAPFSIV